MLTVVTGPPCSGKSTYVRERARVGDIVIDFDVIAQALGSPVAHQHPSPIRRVTGAARRAAIEAAVKEHEGGATVWIVDTNITDYRARVYRNVGADVVMLSVDRGELHRRAARERPKQWHALIDEWCPPQGAVAWVGGGSAGVGGPGSREW